LDDHCQSGIISLATANVIALVKAPHLSWVNIANITTGVITFGTANIIAFIGTLKPPLYQAE